MKIKHYLGRAVNHDEYELNILLTKNRDKKINTRFLFIRKQRRKVLKLNLFTRHAEL